MPCIHIIQSNATGIAIRRIMHFSSMQVCFIENVVRSPRMNLTSFSLLVSNIECIKLYGKICLDTGFLGFVSFIPAGWQTVLQLREIFFPRVVLQRVCKWKRWRIYFIYFFVCLFVWLVAVQYMVDTHIWIKMAFKQWMLNQLW